MNEQLTGVKLIDDLSEKREERRKKYEKIKVNDLLKKYGLLKQKQSVFNFMFEIIPPIEDFRGWGEIMQCCSPGTTIGWNLYRKRLLTKIGYIGADKEVI